MVEKSGMTVLSSHTTHGLSDEELASGDFTEALKWWEQCIAAHKEAGMESVSYTHLDVYKRQRVLQAMDRSTIRTDRVVIIAFLMW